MIRDSRARSTHLPLLGLLLTLGLTACGTTPDQAEPDPPVLEEPALETGEPTLPVFPPSPHAQLHARIEARLLAGDWPGARVLLADWSGTLPANEAAWRDYYIGWTAWMEGDSDAALASLNTAAASARDPRLQQRIWNLARHIATLRQDHLQAARLGTRQLATTDDLEQRAALQRELWRTLLRLSPRQLEAALEQAEGEWRGWLELSALDRPDQPTAAMRNDLQAWLEAYPDHPAGQMLPGGLGFLRKAEPLPGQVALLLPLTGELAPAARAIRDGYLAQHYLTRSAAESDTPVRIIDTGDFANASSAYRQAVADGASLVIGPLHKDAVAELAQLQDRRVPVIALNRSDEAPSQAGAALLQMSLAPEDEMRHLAAQAFGEGARRALLVRPTGERGSRLTDALVEEWNRLGGQLADTLTYSSPEAWSDGLKTALHLHASEQRARNIRAMLATSIEFTPRRRQDLDAVFLLAGAPAEARSLKPLLAFHYAGALPVYAPSAVFSGTADPRDRDLDGVRIAELPWLLGGNPGTRVAIAAGDTGSENYPRLNALGADAWLLQSRLPQLQAGPDALLRGNTGLLSLDAQLRIRREPWPAQFDGSELQPR